jgi:hypothetical protein
MSDEATRKQYVCLDFGGANCTYIETDEDHLDQEKDLNLWFAKRGLSGDGVLDWGAERLTVIFDGDLDNPEKFKSIKAIGIYGPKIFEIGSGGPSMSGFAVYLEVEADNDLSEEELEDIFHLIIPVVEDENAIVAFTEFDDYSVLFEEPTVGVRSINVFWPELK